MNGIQILAHIHIYTQYLSNSPVLFLMTVDNRSYKTHSSVVWHEAQSTDDTVKSQVSFHHSCHTLRGSSDHCCQEQ